MPNNSEIAQSFFVYIKDQNTGIIKKIAFTCDIQIGSSVDNSKVLKLFGGFALSVAEFDSLNIKVPSNISLINVKCSNITATNIVVTLPDNPLDGQLHFIKDVSGVASTIQIMIYPCGGSTIDGVTFKTITTNYGSMIVYASGGTWYVLSSGGSVGDTTASYVVVDYSGSLPNQRKLTAGSNISITDNGPGNTIVITNNLSGTTSSTDVSASYLVLSNTASLSNERVFTPGNGLSGSDAGSNSTYTVSINNNITATISGSAFSQLSGSLSKLANGTSFLVQSTNVSIVSASSGQLTITASLAGAVALFTPPINTHVDDLEFDSVTFPSGWTIDNSDGVIITPSGAIDPYSAFTANDSAHAPIDTDFRRSHMAFQGSTEGSLRRYAFYKTVTVPTNRVLWARFGAASRFTSTSGDSECGISFYDGLGNVVSILQLTDEPGRTQIRCTNETISTYTSVVQSGFIDAGKGYPWDYFAIHKRGTTYHFWTFTDAGQRHYWGSTTHTATMTRIAIYVGEFAQSTVPGNTYHMFDFIRNIDSATQLPT